MKYVLVVDFLKKCEMNNLYIDVVMCDPVHDVKPIHGLYKPLTASANLSE